MQADPLSANADALAVAAAVRTGDVSPQEMAEAAIERIDDRDRKLSFLVEERFEAALEEADALDRSLPLAGVPVLTKDFLATVAGLPLTECSSFIPGWTPQRDCEYVARLKRAGAIVLGSVTSAELAVLSSCEPHRYGPTGNPAAPGRTTGGSSGGSAAAVASGAVPVAHGSDAGGSIRMPAACCGLVGLKPTRGRNPLGPEYGDLGAGTWAEHVLSRSVRDSAAFLDATSGPAPGDPYLAPVPARSFREAAAAEPPPLRIAVSPSLPSGAPLHPDSAAGLRKVADLLSALGHRVEEGNPSFDLAGAEHDFFTLFSACLAARVEMWVQRLGREPAVTDLEPYTWYLLERGRASAGPEVIAAIARLQRASREIAAFYETTDLWLSPTLGIPPFPLGYLDAGPGLSVEEVLERDAVFTAFTWPSNMTGQPALSFPAHRSDTQVPIGVQLTGRFGDEDTLLSLAGSLERHLIGGER
jgi:amidase